MQKLLTDQKDQIKENRLDFKHLPGYARFLKTHHLDEFVQLQYKLAKDIKLPLLKFFESMPEEQLIRISTASIEMLFDYLIENRAADHIEYTIKQWLENQLPQV